MDMDFEDNESEDEDEANEGLTIVDIDTESSSNENAGVEDFLRNYKKFEEKRSSEYSELRRKALDLYAKGDFKAANAVARQISGESVEPKQIIDPPVTSESAKPEPIDTAIVQPPLNAYRLRIKAGASMQDVLHELVGELKQIQQATISPAQRIGVQSAIRLIERGVYVEPT